MPLTLVATPGATNANSYALVTEADAAALLRPGAEGAAWAALSSDEKIQRLVSATATIDSLHGGDLRFIGSRATLTQALEWPREDAIREDDVEYASNVLPSRLVNATIALALAYYDTTRASDLSVLSPAIKSVRAEGDATIEWFQSPDMDDLTLAVLPALVQRLLRPLFVFLDAQVGNYGTGVAVRAS